MDDVPDRNFYGGYHIEMNVAPSNAVYPWNGYVIILWLGILRV